jgi:hypothetical protein
LNTLEIKIFRLLTQDPSPLIEAELKQALSNLPLDTLFNLNNTTGYSVLHVATSSNDCVYGETVLNAVL